MPGVSCPCPAGEGGRAQVPARVVGVGAFPVWTHVYGLALVAWGRERGKQGGQPGSPHISVWLH